MAAPTLPPSTTNVAPDAPLSPTIRSARMEEIFSIVTLHSEAFADKFGSAFGTRQITKGAEALAVAWQRQGASALQGMFVADLDGAIIGTTMLRTWEMESDYTATTELAFQQILGFWGATRSIFALSLLNHRIMRDEAFITDVAVSTPYRRRGVARALLHYAEQRAQHQHKSHLGLYVSSRNHAAQSLYRAMGFRQERVRRSWLTRLVFGQRVWIYMRKNLRRDFL